MDNKSLGISKFTLALFFLPIFISFDDGFGISLARPGVYFENIKFLFTIPLNLILFLFHIVFFGLLSIYFHLKRNSKISITGVVSYLVIIFGYLFALVLNEARGILIGSGLVLLFLFFQTILVERVQILPYMKIVNAGFLYMLVPGILASLLLIISSGNFYLVNHPGEIVSNYLAIYNFEQYFAINLVLAFGLMIDELKTNFKKFLIYFCLVMFVSYVSENSTAILINIGLLVAYVIYKFAPKHYSLFIWVYLIFSILFFISFPFASYFYIEHQSSLFALPGGGFWDRIQLHNYYISHFKLINLVFPAGNEEWFINGRDTHHQFLSFLFACGFVFAFFIYLHMTKILMRTRIEDRFIFASIIFIVGGMVEPLTHPYIMVQFFLFFMLSFVENKKRKQI